MIDAGVLFRILVALSLVGAHMQQHRLVDQFRTFKGLFELSDVMTVKGSVISETKIFKDRRIIKRPF